MEWWIRDASSQQPRALISQGGQEDRTKKKQVHACSAPDRLKRHHFAAGRVRILARG